VKRERVKGEGTPSPLVFAVKGGMIFQWGMVKDENGQNKIACS